MENKVISEDLVKSVLNTILNEQISKVKREDLNRVLYKIEELQNSLNETIKDFRKLQDCLPEGLKSLTNGRISGISSNLSNTEKLLMQLREKIRQHKKTMYSQQVDEKKKP